MEVHKMRVWIDPRATENFVSMSVTMKLGLMLMNDMSEEIELPNGQTSVIDTRRALNGEQFV